MLQFGLRSKLDKINQIKFRIATAGNFLICSILCKKNPDGFNFVHQEIALYFCKLLHCLRMIILPMSVISKIFCRYIVKINDLISHKHECDLNILIKVTREIFS